MANLLLSRTYLLTFKCDGSTIIPQRGKHNSATVKAVVDLLKYAEPEILFVGDEAIQPSIESYAAQDCFFVRIHVMDPPSTIEFTKCPSKTINWFSKQLRGNKEHIVFPTIIDNGAGLLTAIDIYVRGILIPVRESSVYRMTQPRNRLDYAI